MEICLILARCLAQPLNPPARPARPATSPGPQASGTRASGPQAPRPPSRAPLLLSLLLSTVTIDSYYGLLLLTLTIDSYYRLLLSTLTSPPIIVGSD